MIFAFVFAYAKSRFSYDAAQINIHGAGKRFVQRAILKLSKKVTQDHIECKNLIFNKTDPHCLNDDTGMHNDPSWSMDYN